MPTGLDVHMQMTLNICRCPNENLSRKDDALVYALKEQKIDLKLDFFVLSFVLAPFSRGTVLGHPPGGAP